MISMSTLNLKTVQLRSASSQSWEDALAKTKIQVANQFANIQSLEIIEKMTGLDDLGNDTYFIDALLTYAPKLSWF